MTSFTSPSADADRSNRRWRWFWIASALAFMAVVTPTFVDLYRLWSARRDADLPKALSAANDLAKGFFGPMMSSWLDDIALEIRDEVVQSNLLSIKRLVPDSQESAYAEMELGRLAIQKGDAAQAALHLERYLKSGLGRDANLARLHLSDAYRDLKKYEESALLLRVVLKQTPSPEERIEASFKLGELYQFHLDRTADAVKIYKEAMEDTAVPSRWRNDILTNLALLKEQ